MKAGFVFACGGDEIGLCLGDSIRERRLRVSRRALLFLLRERSRGRRKQQYDNKRAGNSDP
jgi:hypothetical protein